MKPSFLFLSAALLMAGVSAGLAQDTKAPPPDPSHITFTHLGELNWVGSPTGSQQHFDVLGDPKQPGLYIRLAKWLPNHHSVPHFHNNIRHMFVLSGTWWVSSGSTYNEASLYPMTAGSIVTDIAEKSHYDGAKNEPAIILEVGLGPLTETDCNSAPAGAPPVMNPICKN
jgi:hypothetical protein